jgi:hypothetical protein
MVQTGMIQFERPKELDDKLNCADHDAILRYDR